MAVERRSLKKGRYGEAIAEWLRLHGPDAPPVPSEAPPEERSAHAEDLSARYLIEDAAAAADVGYEVVDLEALDERPDERLISMTYGDQELLDPLDACPDAAFEALGADADPFAFVRKLDPSFEPRAGLPPTLESALAAFRRSGLPRSIDAFAGGPLLAGHVARFSHESRRTARRVCLAFFVRSDLYLLLLLDSTGADGNFAYAAHFYAWSFGRGRKLLGTTHKVLDVS